MTRDLGSYRRREWSIPSDWSTVDESRSSVSAAGSVPGVDSGERREFKAPGSTTDATTGSSDDTVAQVGDARGFEHPD